ncbi:MAG: hypothetical protein AB9M53_07300 [Leptothrix sp. (in: b-proteobacteria)]
MPPLKSKALKPTARSRFDAAKRDAVDVVSGAVKTLGKTTVTTATANVQVYCPKCGHGFNHLPTSSGKTVGGLSGAAAGALMGAKFGIAGGPLGAIAGTVPGAILGGLFGTSWGAKNDRAKCEKCKTEFSPPD